MDTKNIEELINLLKENDLTELEYEKDDEHIRIKRANSESYAQPVSVSPPYVKPGDHIKQGDVVGVIEAMKVFTNVVADRDGIVEKVLVNNEEGVEYDQPLIQIK